MRITRSQQWHEQTRVDMSQPQYTWPTIALTVHDDSGKPDTVYEFEQTLVEYYRQDRHSFQRWLASWHYENTNRHPTHLRFGGWLMSLDHDHFAIETLDRELESLPLLEALNTAEHYLSFFDDEHSSAYIEHLRDVAGDLRGKVALDRREKLADFVRKSGGSGQKLAKREETKSGETTTPRRM